MKHNSQKYHRKSIRLKGYDYSQEGLYFITIVCQNRTHFFGEIIDGNMILNDAGKMIEKQWLTIAERFDNIVLEEYIVMPNHFHAIVNIPVGATLVVDPNKDPNIKATLVVHPNKDSSSKATLVVDPNKAPPQQEKTDDTINDIEWQPQGIATTGIAPSGNTTTGIAQPPKNKTIGDIIGAFKSITTNEYIKNVKSNNWKRFDKKLWQRNYWEHIIRNKKAYKNISEYIKNNPKKWSEDSKNKL